MKTIRPYTPVITPNALGHDDHSERSLVQVEASDVGRTVEHRGGYKYGKGTYRFTAADVGKLLHCVRISATNPYYCWTFDSSEEAFDAFCEKYKRDPRRFAHLTR